MPGFPLFNYGDRTPVSLRVPECLKIKMALDLGQVCQSAEQLQTHDDSRVQPRVPLVH